MLKLNSCTSSTFGLPLKNEDFAASDFDAQAMADAAEEEPLVVAAVALGSGAMEQAGELSQGDAVRITGSAPLRFTAGPEGAELLVWAMSAGQNT